MGRWLRNRSQRNPQKHRSPRRSSNHKLNLRLTRFLQSQPQRRKDPKTVPRRMRSNQLPRGSHRSPRVQSQVKLISRWINQLRVKSVLKSLRTSQRRIR